MGKNSPLGYFLKIVTRNDKVNRGLISVNQMLLTKVG